MLLALGQQAALRGIVPGDLTFELVTPAFLTSSTATLARRKELAIKVGFQVDLIPQAQLASFLETNLMAHFSKYFEKLEFRAIMSLAMEIYPGG